jgi:transposase InsO family protein
MSEKEILRNQARRLGVIRHFEEVTKSISKTCRYFGISRAAFYRWRNRYQKYGDHGLRDRSRRPLNSPRTTRTEIIAKIIYLRETYHFGPWKIQMYLRRYHDIMISCTGVYRILKRLHMNRLPNHEGQKRYQERFRRYEKPLPGHRIQVDVKFLEKIGEPNKKYYQFTAVDDCTRLRVLKVYDRNSQQNAMRFIDEALSRLPFRAEVIQTDNGSEFGSQFHWHLLDKGIGHVYIRPHRPRLNGKVERSHRIDEEEFYRLIDGVFVDDTNLFNEKVREWENFYNYSRPHAALNGQTPYERFREKVGLCV